MVRVDIKTGNLINKARISEEYGTVDAELDAVAKDNIKKRELPLKECYAAEAV